MTAAELRDRLRAIPDVEVTAPPRALDASLAYLASDAARASLAEDAYWPKWDTPWWHMVLVWELGEARRIPAPVVGAMVDALNALPLHTFPLRPEEWPPGLDPARHASCHCALGSIDQVLAACGVDVDAALPWVRPWYERYQMRDGGLNCDEAAYGVDDECPSSMVGTIAPFEAMRRRGASEFVARGARFLIDRALVRGSDSRHNAEERDSATAWLQPTFPRFYFYDVLRGLSALVGWARDAGEAVPLAAVVPAAAHLAAIAGDGVVRIGRRAHAGKGTRMRAADGTWPRIPLAPTFPLLDEVSEPGAPSPRLTAEWRATRHGLLELFERGLIAA